MCTCGAAEQQENEKREMQDDEEMKCNEIQRDGKKRGVIVFFQKIAYIGMCRIAQQCDEPLQRVIAHILESIPNVARRRVPHAARRRRLTRNQQRRPVRIDLGIEMRVSKWFDAGKNGSASKNKKKQICEKDEECGK